MVENPGRSSEHSDCPEVIEFGDDPEIVDDLASVATI
jgi:hypothetical protein